MIPPICSASLFRFPPIILNINQTMTLNHTPYTYVYKERCIWHKCTSPFNLTVLSLFFVKTAFCLSLSISGEARTTQRQNIWNICLDLLLYYKTIFFSFLQDEVCSGFSCAVHGCPYGWTWRVFLASCYLCRYSHVTKCFKWQNFKHGNSCKNHTYVKIIVVCLFLNATYCDM